MSAALIFALRSRFAVFLPSYIDGLTDLDLASYLDYAREQDISVKPNLSYHIVQTDPRSLVSRIRRSSRNPASDSMRDFSS
jgi:hypothetical protein